MLFLTKSEPERLYAESVMIYSGILAGTTSKSVGYTRHLCEELGKECETVREYNT